VSVEGELLDRIINSKRLNYNIVSVPENTLPAPIPRLPKAFASSNRRFNSTIFLRRQTHRLPIEMFIQRAPRTASPLMVIYELLLPGVVVIVFLIAPLALEIQVVDRRILHARELLFLGRVGVVICRESWIPERAS
jgi:hypothetical protein